jgi:hypothetical protein
MTSGERWRILLDMVLHGSCLQDITTLKRRGRASHIHTVPLDRTLSVRRSKARSVRDHMAVLVDFVSGSLNHVIFVDIPATRPILSSAP